MDPDPFSLFGIIFTSHVLATSSFLFYSLVFIICFGLGMLLILSILEKTFRDITEIELESLEANDKNIFYKLKHLFHQTENLSTLLAWSRLFWAVTSSLGLILLLLSLDFNYLITISICLCLIMLAAWVVPAYIQSSERTLHIGLRSSLWFLNLNKTIANSLAPLAPELPTEDVSLEDLKTALPESDQKTLSVANLNLYKQVLRFDKISIKNVMRPKKEIVGINENYNFKEVLSKIELKSFSRLPVYDREWKKIKGIVHCKDLLPYTSSKKLKWTEFIRPILFVQESDLAHAVLKLFQNTKNHMAIVQNTKAQIVGIVTLEDITEEIIGEIEDE